MPERGGGWRRRGWLRRGDGSDGRIMAMYLGCRNGGFGSWYEEMFSIIPLGV